MATTTGISLLTDRENQKRFKDSGMRVIDHLSVEEAKTTKKLFVLCKSLALPQIADVITAANGAKHLLGLLVEQDRDLGWITIMLDRANLRMLRNTFVHDDMQVFERVLNAWRIGAQGELIADATIQGTLLFVRSASLDTLEVDVRSLKALKAAAHEDLVAFEVARDGSHIHWPSLDVHLDLESLRVALDPQLQTKFKAERLKHDELLGQAIKWLRGELGLSQSEIEGVSARQVRRIEQGAQPRSETLELMAHAHGLTLNAYLNKLSQRIAAIAR
ncbi:MAG: DUF2442 domain-containing protein [Bradymonadaceae bacterium]|nr:DUF2442 domain-containing protein [Lujinxingiaceae bacterium]